MWGAYLGAAPASNAEGASLGAAAAKLRRHLPKRLGLVEARPAHRGHAKRVELAVPLLLEQVVDMRVELAGVDTLLPPRNQVEMRVEEAGVDILLQEMLEPDTLPHRENQMAEVDTLLDRAPGQGA